MEAIEKLTELFRKFPGIGPRQARRFVYFLLSQDPKITKELEVGITKLRNEVRQCQSCFRFFGGNGEKGYCGICLDPNIDGSILVIVEKDIDLEQFRKATTLRPRFFVLGGLDDGIHLKELILKITDYLSRGLKEIICAFSASPTADHTTQTLKEKLTPLLSSNKVKFSVLGRGLSTGTELEYSDPETIKQALANRK